MNHITIDTIDHMTYDHITIHTAVQKRMCFLFVWCLCGGSVVKESINIDPLKYIMISDSTFTANNQCAFSLNIKIPRVSQS